MSTNKIIGKNGCGKTTKLIIKCYEENLKPNNLTYIVCPTKDDARFIMDLANNLKINIPYPMTMIEYIERNSGTWIRNVLIDDIDKCILVLNTNRFNVLGMSMRYNEEEFKENEI